MLNALRTSLETSDSTVAGPETPAPVHLLLALPQHDPPLPRLQPCVALILGNVITPLAKVEDIQAIFQD
ncbi:UNVERIFIED_CONTAM: hypothetical protein FKN15_032686 [Acipenser sinensis]